MNAIAPGLMATEKTTEQPFGGGEHIEEMTEMIQAGRFAEVEVVTDAASYLVSDYASYSTGAVLTIDGGESLNKGFLRFTKDPPTQRS